MPKGSNLNGPVTPPRRRAGVPLRDELSPEWSVPFYNLGLMFVRQYQQRMARVAGQLRRSSSTFGKSVMRWVESGPRRTVRLEGGNESLEAKCGVHPLGGAGPAFRLVHRTPMPAFRYAQRERDGSIHGGRSMCDLAQHEGRTRVIEHFAWTTRAGSGENVFDEVIDG